MALVLMDHYLRFRAQCADVVGNTPVITAEPEHSDSRRGAASHCRGRRVEPDRGGGDRGAAARKFPCAALHALDDERHMGRPLAMRSERDRRRVAAFDFSRVNLVFFCGRAALSERYAEAAAAHAWVIDSSSAFRARQGVPLIAADVNAEALDGKAGRGLVALPGSASVRWRRRWRRCMRWRASNARRSRLIRRFRAADAPRWMSLPGRPWPCSAAKSARAGLRPADRLQCDSAGRCAGSRWRLARGTALMAGNAADSGSSATCDQCHRGAGAGLFRPQPGGARQL